MLNIFNSQTFFDIIINILLCLYKFVGYARVYDFTLYKYIIFISGFILLTKTGGNDFTNELSYLAFISYISCTLLSEAIIFVIFFLIYLKQMQHFFVTIKI